MKYVVPDQTESYLWQELGSMSDKDSELLDTVLDTSLKLWDTTVSPVVINVEFWLGSYTSNVPHDS